MSAEKKLFIDDIREVPKEYTHSARTFKDALKMILFEDWDLISFDHDLGEKDIDKNGLTLLNLLEHFVYFKLRKAPKIIAIHSANLGARKAMEQAARSIERMEEIIENS